jgi:curli biogenesis system outer membrane secretion channel CsgG
MMKTNLHWASALALCACMGGARAAELQKSSNQSALEVSGTAGKCSNGLKVRMAILGLGNKSTFTDPKLMDALQDMLITEVSGTNCFILVSQDEIAKIMQQQGIQLSGAIDPNLATQPGKIIGAEYILTGAITQFVFRSEMKETLISDEKIQIADAGIDLRLINTTTGEIRASFQGTGTARRSQKSTLGFGTTGGYDASLEGQALRESLRGFSNRVAGEISKDAWSCLGMAKSGKVYMDAGVRVGVKVGDVFRLASRGEAIYSPTSGALMGYDEQDLGDVRVDRQMGSDASIALPVTVGVGVPNGAVILRKK